MDALEDCIPEAGTEAVSVTEEIFDNDEEEPSEEEDDFVADLTKLTLAQTRKPRRSSVSFKEISRDLLVSSRTKE